AFPEDVVEVAAVALVARVLGNVIALLGMKDVEERERDADELFRAVGAGLADVAPAVAERVGLQRLCRGQDGWHASLSGDLGSATAGVYQRAGRSPKGNRADQP